MLAYSAQDLILEPFAGLVFGFTPGESTSLAGVQHGGVLAGMLLRARRALSAARLGSLRTWTDRRLRRLGRGARRLVAAGVVAPGLAAAGLRLRPGRCQRRLRGRRRSAR